MFSYQYPRAAITTDAIVFVRNRRKEISGDKDLSPFESTSVLLIQRGQDPYKNKWALPGGFIEMNETLETSCKRELAEETGLEIDNMIQFKTYDAIDRDPRHRTISVVFFAELDKKQVVKGGDDAAQAKWFLTNDLPELAFDHEQILNDFFNTIGT